MISLPVGWTQRGELPSIDFEMADAGTRDRFDEDILQLSDPTGDFMIDVGWYPAESPTGSFICKLVQQDNWDEPLEEFTTRSISKVDEWVGSVVEAIQIGAGQPGEIAKSGKFMMTVAIVLPRQTAGSLVTESGGPRAKANTPQLVELTSALAS